MIKFTIITITYNAEKNLPVTIESVKQQKYSNIEHIIVDGASKDSTVYIAKNYKENINKELTNIEVKLISEPDDGLYYAMNKGLKLASGDFTLFLNAGDSLKDSRTLELIADKLQESTEPELPEIVYGDTDIVDKTGKFLRHRRLKTPKHLTKNSFLKGMTVCHQAFFVQTSLAKTQLYDIKYRYSADFDWCIRIMKTAKKPKNFMKLPFVTTLYLDEGLTTANHEASLKERFTIMCKHYGYFKTILMHIWFVIRAVFKK